MRVLNEIISDFDEVSNIIYLIVENLWLSKKILPVRIIFPDELFSLTILFRACFYNRCLFL